MFLASERATLIKSMALRFNAHQFQSAFLIQRLLGLIASSVFVVQFTCLWRKPLQNWFIRWVNPKLHSNSKCFFIPRSLLTDLFWWTRDENLSKGDNLGVVVHDLVFTLDPPFLGWGVHCPNSHVSGLWSPSEKSLHINVLEIRAICNALNSFTDILHYVAVLLVTDNTTATYYINWQGGTTLLQLWRETKLI